MEENTEVSMSKATQLAHERAKRLIQTFRCSVSNFIKLPKSTAWINLINAETISSRFFFFFFNLSTWSYLKYFIHSSNRIAFF